MITLDQVTKIYKPKKDDYIPIKALDKLSLHIKAQEFVILVGSSGAGKSTLLKLLTCQEKPTSGQIFVGGIDLVNLSRNDIPKLRRKIGFIYQDFKLLPNKTVAQNVAYALEITGVSTATIKKILPKVIKMVNLSGREYSLPNELSGGEMQRVAIARSLTHQPKILLADEPTGNLDRKNSWKVIELLIKLNELGATVLLATHDQEVVRKLKYRKIEIANGKIKELSPAIKS